MRPSTAETRGFLIASCTLRVTEFAYNQPTGQKRPQNREKKVQGTGVAGKPAKAWGLFGGEYKNAEKA